MEQQKLTFCGARTDDSWIKNVMLNQLVSFYKNAMQHIKMYQVVFWPVRVRCISAMPTE